MVRSTFKSSIGKNILMAIPFIFLAEMAIVGMLTSARTESSRSGLIVAALIFPLFMVPVVLFFRIKIQITDEEIRFSRFGITYRRIPIGNNSFSGYVQRINYQMVIPVHYRYLQVIYSDGRVKNYQCFGFSKKTYERLIGETQILGGSRQSASLADLVLPLQSTEDSGAVSDPSSGELPFGGVQLVFPKEMFVKLLIKNFVISAVWTAILVIFFAVGLAYSFLSNVRMSDKLLYALSAPAGILLAVIAVIIFLMWLFYRKRIRKVPETIRITDNAIRIDDRTFSPGEIRQIKMTPERYLVYNNYNQRNYRKLRIETTGQTYEYILGHVAALKNCYYYPEYGALQRSVDALLQQVGKKAIMITF
ncbi:MAG: hypothetical protein PHP22_03365 [Oscillospiraceae bacterium]|nr:hypothetical protein [Oscillospiraceae bacterium]